MAQLSIQQDPAAPGALVVASESPAALAATCDALVQELGGPTDALALWALHPHEQDELREAAYAHERQELGQFAQVQVVELPRPREQHVVWIDRYHLLATAAPPAKGSRILGLYAGSRGGCALYVHDVSVTGMVAPLVAELAPTIGKEWEDPNLLSLVRFAVRYTAREPGQVAIRCAQHQLPATLQALHGLQGVVAPWS